MRHSADLAGRAVRIAADVPVVFDGPLAPHHKIIGRWAAGREDAERRYTRSEARCRIEQVFDAAVLEVLNQADIANLHVSVLIGDDALPPALAVTCDDIGQIELGWIEKDNVLSNTLCGPVAPVGWQAAAYKVLAETLGSVLTLFDYDDLFDEISAYYWDGATNDEDARYGLSVFHGMADEDLAEIVLPSQMNARRPAWMLSESAAPLKHLPPGLRKRIRVLRNAHKALQANRAAWAFEQDVVHEYLPDLFDCSTLPGLTLVPFDHFGRELDEVGRNGMEMGFMDLAGLRQLPDVDALDDWFVSLRLGVDLLRSAQNLINTDPTHP